MGVVVVFVYPILFHSCTDSSNVLCLSLLEVKEHVGSDILDNCYRGVTIQKSGKKIVFASGMIPNVLI